MRRGTRIKIVNKVHSDFKVVKMVFGTWSLLDQLITSLVQLITCLDRIITSLAWLITGFHVPNRSYHLKMDFPEGITHV